MELRIRKREGGEQRAAAEVDEPGGDAGRVRGHSDSEKRSRVASLARAGERPNAPEAPALETSEAELEEPEFQLSARGRAHDGQDDGVRAQRDREQTPGLRP